MSIPARRSKAAADDIGSLTVAVQKKQKPKSRHVRPNMYKNAPGKQQWKKVRVKRALDVLVYRAAVKTAVAALGKPAELKKPAYPAIGSGLDVGGISDFTGNSWGKSPPPPRPTPGELPNAKDPSPDLETGVSLAPAEAPFNGATWGKSPPPPAPAEAPFNGATWGRTPKERKQQEAITQAARETDIGQGKTLYDWQQMTPDEQMAHQRRKADALNAKHGTPQRPGASWKTNSRDFQARWPAHPPPNPTPAPPPPAPTPASLGAAAGRQSSNNATIDRPYSPSTSPESTVTRRPDEGHASIDPPASFRSFDTGVDEEFGGWSPPGAAFRRQQSDALSKATNAAIARRAVAEGKPMPTEAEADARYFRELSADRARTARVEKEWRANKIMQSGASPQGARIGTNAQPTGMSDPSAAAARNTKANKIMQSGMSQGRPIHGILERYRHLQKSNEAAAPKEVRGMDNHQQWGQVRVKRARAPSDLIKWAEYLWATRAQLRCHLDKRGMDQATAVLAIANTLQMQEKKAAVKQAVITIIAQRVKSACKVKKTTRQEVIGKPKYAMGKLKEMHKDAAESGLTQKVDAASLADSLVGGAKTVGKGALGGAIGLPAALGAAGGGLYGLADPGEDEEGNQRSRVWEAIKRGLIGGTIGAGAGATAVAGGVGGAALGLNSAAADIAPQLKQFGTQSAAGLKGLSERVRQQLNKRGFDLPANLGRNAGYGALGGAGLGALYGGLSSPDEDKDESRLGNALKYGLGGAAVGGAGGAGLSYLQKMLGGNPVNAATPDAPAPEAPAPKPPKLSKPEELGAAAGAQSVAPPDETMDASLAEQGGQPFPFNPEPDLSVGVGTGFGDTTGKRTPPLPPAIRAALGLEEQPQLPSGFGTGHSEIPQEIRDELGIND